MSEYREGCIQHKKVQRGIEDMRPVSGRKKAGPKPFRLECECVGWRTRVWSWSGRYADLKTADQAFTNQCRKHPHWNWRVLDGEQMVRSYTATPPA